MVGLNTDDREAYDVFLSHRSEDKPTVERLAEKLVEEAGLALFSTVGILFPASHGRKPWNRR